jgi:hypothetical protein
MRNRSQDNVHVIQPKFDPRSSLIQIHAQLDHPARNMLGSFNDALNCRVYTTVKGRTISE